MLGLYASSYDLVHITNRTLHSSTFQSCVHLHYKLYTSTILHQVTAFSVCFVDSSLDFLCITDCMVSLRHLLDSYANCKALYVINNEN